MFRQQSEPRQTQQPHRHRQPSMAEELKSVLDLYREKEKHLEIKTTPNVFIKQNSTPYEVRQWLKQKQFGERCIYATT